MTKLFLSYARGDDEPFVKRLYEDLTARGFDVWWDRVSMPNRGLEFTVEIREAIAAADRFVLVIGPAADRLCGALITLMSSWGWFFRHPQAGVAETPGRRKSNVF